MGPSPEAEHSSLCLSSTHRRLPESFDLDLCCFCVTLTSAEITQAKCGGDICVLSLCLCTLGLTSSYLRTLRPGCLSQFCDFTALHGSFCYSGPQYPCLSDRRHLANVPGIHCTEHTPPVVQLCQLLIGLKAEIHISLLGLPKTQWLCSLEKCGWFPMTPACWKLGRS